MSESSHRVKWSFKFNLEGREIYVVHMCSTPGNHLESQWRMTKRHIPARHNFEPDRDISLRSRGRMSFFQKKSCLVGGRTRFCVS